MFGADRRSHFRIHKSRTNQLSTNRVFGSTSRPSNKTLLDAKEMYSDVTSGTEMSRTGSDVDLEMGVES